MAENKKPRSKIRLVFIGVRQSVKNKLRQTFCKLEDDGTLAKESRAYANLKGLGRPGAIYDVECDAEDDGSIYPGTLTYVGQWKDAEKVVTWQAQHDAAVAADRARRRHNNEAKRNLVEERLKPLRAAYWQCTGLKRAALLAQIVGYVTSRLSEERG